MQPFMNRGVYGLKLGNTVQNSHYKLTWWKIAALFPAQTALQPDSTQDYSCQDSSRHRHVDGDRKFF